MTEFIFLLLFLACCYALIREEINVQRDIAISNFIKGLTPTEITRQALRMLNHYVDVVGVDRNTVTVKETNGANT